VRLSQVRLLVDDYGACFRFYRDALGLEAGFGDEATGYADFAAGDGTIALFVRSEQAEVVDLREPGDAALVVLGVDDVDAEVARLRDRGVAFEGEPRDRRDWGLRVAYTRDPAGTLIELPQSIPMDG
jgi:lactoylglutathione lyase